MQNKTCGIWWRVLLQVQMYNIRSTFELFMTVKILLVMFWVLLSCSWGSGVCSSDDSKGMIWWWFLFIWSFWQYDLVLVSVHLIILTVWFGAGFCSSDHSESMIQCLCLFIWSFWQYDSVLVSVHLIILTVWFGAGVCSSDDTEGNFYAKICLIVLWVQFDGTGNHFIVLSHTFNGSVLVFI